MKDEEVGVEHCKNVLPAMHFMKYSMPIAFTIVREKGDLEILPPATNINIPLCIVYVLSKEM